MISLCTKDALLVSPTLNWKAQPSRMKLIYNDSLDCLKIAHEMNGSIQLQTIPGSAQKYLRIIVSHHVGQI